MRIILITLLCTLAGSLLLPAQQPGSGVSSNDKKLFEILEAWRKESQTLETMIFTFQTEAVEPALPEPNKGVGMAKLRKRQGNAVQVRVDLGQATADGKIDPNRLTYSYIYNGDTIYQMVHKEKQVNTFKTKDGQMKEGVLPFLRGMSLEETIKRYTISCDKIDTNYSYVNIIPRVEADNRDFSKAVLVFANKSFTDPSGKVLLPQNYISVLQWEEPNRTRNTWKITQLWRNEQTRGFVNEEDFLLPRLTADWKVSQGGTSSGGGVPTKK